MKSTLSSLDIMIIIRELNPVLENGIVSNIYQVGTLFIFRIHTREGKQDLLIEPPRRIHLTKYSYEKPRTPPSFCMLLRKVLRQSRIEHVKQLELERVIEIKFRKKGEYYKLMVELFREGNLILLNDKGEIIGALRYRKMRDRVISRGLKYSPPPRMSLNPLRASPSEILELFSKSKGDLVRNLVTRLGIPGEIAEELCYLVNLPKSKPVREISFEEISKILNVFRKIYNRLSSGQIQPCIAMKGELPLGVYPFHLVHMSDVKFVDYSSFNEAVDEYFFKILSMEISKEANEKVQDQVRKLMRRVESHRRLLKQYEELSERYRNLADIIYLNLDVINQLLHLLQRLRQASKDWSEVLSRLKEYHPNIASLIYNLNPRKAEVVVKIENFKIPLDFRLSAAQNANKYYMLAKDYQRKVKRIQEMIRKELKELSKPPKVMITLPKLREKSKREWFERFYWFQTTGGFLVIGGRDAKQNELLVRKYLSNNDLFFHADIHGASAVIMLTQGKTPSNEDIKEAATFAAVFSRAWRNCFSSIDVYWVYGHQVSKAPPPGEYLPRGAFMIRGKRNYIRGVPLRLRICLVQQDDKLRLIAAPPSTKVMNCLAWVELAPGNVKKREVVESIRKLLMKLIRVKEICEWLSRLRVEEMERLLPPGGAMILKFGEGGKDVS